MYHRTVLLSYQEGTDKRNKKVTHVDRQRGYKRRENCLHEYKTTDLGNIGMQMVARLIEWMEKVKEFSDSDLMSRDVL